jgi:outer membrane protein assembly factor BamB
MSLRTLVVLVLWSVAFACSSGSGAPQCDYKNKSVLATSSWPTFRQNIQNTAAITGIDLTTGALAPLWVFPRPTEPPYGAFAASPVINSTETLIYIGSTDGTLLAVNLADGTLNTTLLSTSAPITSSALAAVRFDTDAIFVGGGDGFLYFLNPTGVTQPTYWPFPVGALVSGGPTLSPLDGTVYVAGISGPFAAVCPNGITRFAYGFAGATSLPAIDQNGTFYFGATDAQLRSIFPNGLFNWAFAASDGIVAAPVYDVTENVVYVADQSGRVFKVTASGQPAAGFVAPHVGPVRASPALGPEKLYVASVDGELYAIETATGLVKWHVGTGAAIQSSPAVAISASGTPVIVFGSNDGHVYFVEDSGMEATVLAVCRLGPEFSCEVETPATSPPPAVRSSPAIATDGTVIIGADDGRLYAIQPLNAG